MAPKKSEKRGTKDEDSSKSFIVLIVLVSIIVILVAIIIAVLFSQQLENESEVIAEPLKEEQAVNETDVVKRIRYWAVQKDYWNPFGNMRSIERTFKALQHKFVNASYGDDWDIMWALPYPYDPEEINKHDPLFCGIENKVLRHDQKVNHFPGIVILTDKSEMSHKNKNLSYILPAFELPKETNELSQFLKENPDVKLVEKDFGNRGVHVVEKKDISWERASKNGVFYQQFMDKPFLIDGHAFDVGVYVLITSFDPMRFYVFDSDVLFRFCKNPYHPFDPQDTDRYVVKEGSHSPDFMPTFEKIYQQYEYPFKTIFNSHIKKMGFNPEELWTKVDDAIVQTIKNSEDRVRKSLETRKMPSHNFFELVRYDFMFDENLNPYIMEVNMSPNLTPFVKKHQVYTSIYEQLLLNVVKMVGFGNYFDFISRFNESDIAVASKKNIAVNIQQCLKDECHKSCSNSISCRICQPCLSTETRFQMRESFRENSYRGNFRRLFPKPEHFEDEKLFESMTKNNQISIEWFYAKCKEDERWC